MVKCLNVENKVVLITGGYGFLGSAITRSLLFHGAKVCVLGRDKNKFDKSFSELSLKETQSLHFIKCDVASTSEILRAFQEVQGLVNRIDVLINNAFYSKGNSPEEMTDEEWELGIDGTLNNVFRCIREVIPFFKKNGKGKIINVSSMYGVVAPQFEIYDQFPQFLNPPHYGAAKAGVIQLTKYYATYLGRYNINVNVITPGPFPSDSVKENQGFVQELSKRTSLNRVGLPEDLAGAFVFLASNASDYITGQNIVVDGGWTAK